MRSSHLLILILLSAGCPGPTAHTIQYAGRSDAERRMLLEANREVYPDDVRSNVEPFKRATLAWPGIVTGAREDPRDPTLSEVVIEHHYWDWMEDHSIQRAKAFLSPRGEGEFVCHAERRTIPTVDIRKAMAVAYVRPIAMVEGRLHCACMLAFFPPDWYATDVFDYGRGGKDLKILRIPMR